MSLLNTFYAKGSITRGDMKVFLILLNPMAPHITEEIYQALPGSGESIMICDFPVYDEALNNKDNEEKSLAGQAYLNIAGRIQGEDIPFIDLDEPKCVLDKIKRFFKSLKKGE